MQNLIRPPRPPPLPPPLPPLGPNFPIGNYILERRNRRRYKERLIYKERLMWYLITLVMRLELQTRNQKPKDEWVIVIEEKMEQVLREDAITSWDKHCIYIVPHNLKQNDRNSYFPETVSLGPYHHGNRHLRPMDHHKWRAVNMVMKRNEQGIDMYINAMKELEMRARACYEGPINLNSKEFIKMLILDGCFVLELFRGAYKENGFLELGYDRKDPVFAMRASMHSIQRDMVLLENQLPLFVLNRLLELQLGSRNQTGLVAHLAVRFFDPLMPTDEPLTKTDQLNLEYSLATDKAFDPFVMNSLGDKSGLHCLDAFRRSLLQSTKTERSLPQKRVYGGLRVVDKRKKQMIHCVTKLRDGGIKFRKRQSDRFWDIHFTNGYLEIPKLFIHDGTKSLFLNLIAFEQNHIDSSNDITSYIVFMDNLIDSPEDVGHLRDCGIIEHWLESDSEVADLFNRIGQDTIFDISRDSHLFGLSNAAKRYYLHNNKYYRKWNAWKKTLKQKYFDSPWGYISFFAALFLLILTSSQSYFAAYSYYRPPS
ncbi:hypothetical protein CARUB_v10018846mg [Capsella rubella]|uniref:Uncharacterized protein n=1 Tax=Capsella rubella TaxID=81985 RepID=R0HNN3_9BRAS|nr:UPF0481 protein At3g47200 [Capsella rubella]EOA25503.1 hypothetical protein CARUB_v10018846mg [Capsella rubella]